MENAKSINRASYVPAGSTALLDRQVKARKFAFNDHDKGDTGECAAQQAERPYCVSEVEKAMLPTACMCTPA